MRVTAIAVADELGDDALRVSALSAAAFLGRDCFPPLEAVVYEACARGRSHAGCGDTDSLKLSAGGVLGQVLVDCGEYEAAREGVGTRL